MEFTIPTLKKLEEEVKNNPKLQEENGKRKDS